MWVRPSGMNFGTTIVAEALPLPSDIYEMNYRCGGVFEEMVVAPPE
jgi:hypothetical protein